MLQSRKWTPFNRFKKEATPVNRNRRHPVGRSNKKTVQWLPLLKVALIIVVMMGLLWLWPQLMNWVNRPIARVEVHAGFESLQRVDVEKQLEPFLVNRFFHLDLNSMQDVLVAMPWVREVSLRRRWPDLLEVTLLEQEAVARWKQGQLITGEGILFMPDSVSDFEQLPLLSGPDDDALEVMQQYLAISQLLRPMGLSVTELNLGSADSWRFRVDHVDVHVGRDRRMERLQRFVRLYHARLDSRWNEVVRVDLRYLNGAAVAWQND